MTLPKPCKTCGEPTLNGTRCDDCTTETSRARYNAPQDAREVVAGT